MKDITEKLDTIFRQMGFTPVAKHKTKDITLYRQGDINYLLNADPDGHAAQFVRDTRVDALAVAMGTSHGAYKFTRRPDGEVLAMHVIEEIHRQLPAPGVLALCWDRFDGRHEPSHATAEAVAAWAEGKLWYFVSMLGP